MNINKTVRYMGGFWDGHYEHDARYLAAFLLTHGIDKEGFDFFKQVQAGLELHIQGDRALTIYQYPGGNFTEKELIANNMLLPIKDWEDRKLFFLEKNTRGNHVLGGKKPEELVLPAHDQLNTPFQYLGTIDGTDPVFSWMKIDKLHLVYPLYECNFGIYLDYTEPNSPKVINPETIVDYWYSPDFATLNNVEFTETRYQITTAVKAEKYMDMETGRETNNVLLCGVPIWYQAQEVPICPKTDELMSYVCTINSDPEIQVVNKPPDQKYPYDSSLIFADLGHLYVFFHPGSKILCLYVQFDGHWHI